MPRRSSPCLLFRPRTIRGMRHPASAAASKRSASRPRDFRGMRHHFALHFARRESSRPRDFRGMRHLLHDSLARLCSSRPRDFRGMRHPMAPNRLLSLRISPCRHRKIWLLALHPASTTSVFRTPNVHSSILSDQGEQHTTCSRMRFGNAQRLASPSFAEVYGGRG